MWSTEVLRVPISIWLGRITTFLYVNTLLLIVSIGQQLVEKLYRKNLDFVNFFELWNVHVWPCSDVKEYTIQEEYVSFNVEMLAPR